MRNTTRSRTSAAPARALADIAKKLGLTVRTIDMIDRSGRGPDGNPVPGLPANPALFNGIFSADIGVENDPIQLAGGNGYVWFEAMSSTPSRERPLDEVKDRVVERWRSDQIAARLKDKAKEAVEKLKTASVSRRRHRIRQQAAIHRRPEARPQPGRFPGRCARRRVPDRQGPAGHDRGRQLAMDRVPRHRHHRAADRHGVARMPSASRPHSRNAYSEDILAQYIARLQTELGATINEAALAQVIGGSANSSDGALR